MKYAFWACLVVEATGLVHAVWFLCVIIKKMIWNCVCEKGQNDFSRVSSKTPLDMKDDKVGDDMTVDQEMLKTAEQAEIEIHEEVELVQQQKEERDEYRAEFSTNFP